jgi:hypothetical protein
VESRNFAAENKTWVRLAGGSARQVIRRGAKFSGAHASKLSRAP